MCCLAFVSSAGVGGVALAQTGQAPNVYYDVPTAQAQSEINTWATMYDTLKRTGQPAAGASTFAFSNAAMNTPLFSVLVAAKRTVGDVTGANPCNPLNGTPTTGGGDSLTANTLSWMTSNTVSIDLVDDPQATSSLIQAAASDPNASLSISGSTLQATNLSATPVAGASVAPSYAPVNSNTLLWIEDLTAASVAHAATLNPNDNARRLLLGTPRTVDQVEAFTKTWGSAHGHDFTTYQIEATFGRYGTLPIVVVSVAPEAAGADGFFLLVDGVNGMVDGPFDLGTTPAPAMLLAAHPDAYQSGSEYKAVRAGTGCVALPVAGWQLNPPAPGLWTPAPALPGTGPNSAPGHWQPWVCQATTGGSCKCTSEGEDSDKTTPPPTTPRANVPVRILCTGCTATSPGECATPVPATPATPVPHPTPPATPQTPGAGGGCSCVKQWNW